MNKDDLEKAMQAITGKSKEQREAKQREELLALRGYACGYVIFHAVIWLGRVVQIALGVALAVKLLGY